MKICQDCHHFKYRVTYWNNTHGATDPIPYIDGIIKPHKHLILEKRTVDGAGGTSFIFRCLKCEQRWELFIWSAVGRLDVKPNMPEYILTL